MEQQQHQPPTPSAQPSPPIATLSVTALDCPDPQRLAEFSAAITGWPVGHDSGDWVTLDSGGGPTLAFQRAVDHVPPQWPDAAHPQQVHLDFSVVDLDAAAERVVALGARRTELQPDPSWIVLLDPAGHPFCLVRNAAPDEP